MTTVIQHMDVLDWCARLRAARQESSEGLDDAAVVPAALQTDLPIEPPALLTKIATDHDGVVPAVVFSNGEAK